MTFNQKLLAGAVASLILSISINCILVNYDEIFRFGFELGNIVDNLCLAYVSSYVFYIIVVLGKERVDKTNSVKTITEYSRRISWQGRIMEKGLSKLLGIEYVRYSSEDYDRNRILQALPSIDLRLMSNTISDGVHKTESQLMNDARQRIYTNSDKINTYAFHLDTSYLKLINDIREHDFLNLVGSLLVVFKGVPSGYTSDFIVKEAVKARINSYFEFMSLIVELEEYHKKVMKKYLPDFKEY